MAGPAPPSVIVRRAPPPSICTRRVRLCACCLPHAPGPRARAPGPVRLPCAVPEVSASGEALSVSLCPCPRARPARGAAGAAAALLRDTVVLRCARARARHAPRLLRRAGLSRPRPVSRAQRPPLLPLPRGAAEPASPHTHAHMLTSPRCTRAHAHEPRCDAHPCRRCRRICANPQKRRVQKEVSKVERQYGAGATLLSQPQQDDCRAMTAVPEPEESARACEGGGDGRGGGGVGEPAPAPAPAPEAASAAAPPATAVPQPGAHAGLEPARSEPPAVPGACRARCLLHACLVACLQLSPRLCPRAPPQPRALGPSQRTRPRCRRRSAASA